MTQYKQDTVNIWFPKQIEPIYDPLDPKQMFDFNTYWKAEKDRCMNGFYLDKKKSVYISGWLYFHTVYWKIAMYETLNEGTPNERTIREILTPILRDVDWMIANDLRECETQGKFYSLIGARGFGKELADYEPVMLFNGGMKTIGSCAIGDKLVGKDGKLTTVTGVFPQGEKNIYEMTLLDGRKVHCGLEHLWEVRSGKKTSIMSTKELLSKTLKYKHKKSGFTYKYYLPEIQAIEYQEKSLLIDPYILGCLLGSSSLTNTTLSISTNDLEIVEEFKKRLPDYKIELDNSYVANTEKNIKYTLVYKELDKYDANPLSKTLNVLGINKNCYNKFIPKEYLYGSIEQRMELLRGLMDTDGSVLENGSVKFSSVCETLSDNVAFLCRGLGIRCTITKDEPQIISQDTLFTPKLPTFRVHIRTDKDIFKLTRKLNKIKNRKNISGVAIKDIALIGRHSATCITVDNQDKIFLTRDYIPTHNSIIAASRAGWLYTFFDNSQSVISAGATGYIKLVMDKIEDGLTNLHPIFRKNRLVSNPKVEILAGWKDKSSNQPHAKSSKSQILTKNFEAGNNSMVCNGTRPGFHLIDEVGTLPNFIGCYKDSDGCWWAGKSRTKPSCLVFITGTGGNQEVGAESAEMFYSPSSYNLLEFENEWEGGSKIGRFIPAGTGHLGFANALTLNEYLKIDTSIVDMSHIKILVSDIQRYDKEWWIPNFNKAKKSGNSKTLLKFKAYWCKKPSDSFIVLTKNDYNVEEAKRQQTNIRNNDLRGTPVELKYADNGMVYHEFSDRLPITEFPVKEQSKDAPVVIYEFPMSSPPFGLYTAGVDPYRHSESEYSDSLGSVYIYKRMHEIGSEKYQDMFVASYTARPGDIKDWNETARRLIKYYNARTLCENDEMSFINYMIDKGDGHLLEDTPEWLRLIVPNTTQFSRKKGISRASKQVRSFLDGQYKEYLDQVVLEEKDEKGSVIRQVLGVSRVLDPMLLEETIKFDKEKNFDRVIAAQLAIALANKLNPVVKINSLDTDNRISAYYGRLKNNGSSTESQSKSLFKSRVTSGNKAFGFKIKRLFS